MTARPQLAFDTSTALGSVALGAGGKVLGRRYLTRRSEHARLLAATVQEVLEECAVGRDELGGVVVGSGPGSFTGVRVAAATAKGLVHALGLPLRAYSSLAAGAVGAEVALPGEARAAVIEAAGAEGAGPVLEPPSPEELRYVLFDARGDRVYAGAYRVAPALFEEVLAPRAARLGELLDEGPPPGARFAGSGALRHRERLEEAGFRVLALPAGVPTAEGLLALLSLLPGREPVGDPARWEPDYLREWAGGRAR